MKNIERFELLRQNLRTSELVNSFDSNEEQEAATLAHSLLDMEESFNKISVDLLPKLITKNQIIDNIDSTLIEIMEELRHILYHIKDPKFFEPLKIDNK